MIFRTSQFIVSLNKYLEAASNKFSSGLRFRMKFEGHETPERRYLVTLTTADQLHFFMFAEALGEFFLIRFSGTIVEVGDFSTQWTDSEWR